MSEDLLDDRFFEGRNISRSRARPTGIMELSADEAEGLYNPEEIIRLRRREEESKLPVRASPIVKRVGLVSQKDKSVLAKSSPLSVPTIGKPETHTPTIGAKFVGQPVFRDKFVEIFSNEVCVNATRVMLLSKGARGLPHPEKDDDEKERKIKNKARQVHRALIEETGERAQMSEYVRSCKLVSPEEKKCIVSATKSNSGQCDLVKQVYACNGDLINSYVYGLTNKRIPIADIKECTNKLEDEGLVTRQGKTILGEAVYKMPQGKATIMMGGKEYIQTEQGFILKR